MTFEQATAILEWRVLQVPAIIARSRSGHYYEWLDVGLSEDPDFVWIGSSVYEAAAYVIAVAYNVNPAQIDDEFYVVAASPEYRKDRVIT